MLLQQTGGGKGQSSVLRRPEEGLMCKSSNLRGNLRGLPGGENGRTCMKSWLSDLCCAQSWTSSKNFRYKSFTWLRNTTEIVPFLSQNAGPCTSGHEREITRRPGGEIFISRLWDDLVKPGMCKKLSPLPGIACLILTIDFIPKAGLLLPCRGVQDNPRTPGLSRNRPLATSWHGFA